mmetsp:Transcript_8643/g.13754  ORF Transcript_8643/g.13754 Transcript_8643/m.13754 type:complete len:84 (+) Transcript_8643:540-791(+)
MRVTNLSGADFPLLSSVEPYVMDTNPDSSSRGGNDRDHVRQDDWDEEASVQDWWEQSMENSHFGGGSHFDMSSNSTILDAEIL